jgi:hypothetical protein
LLTDFANDLEQRDTKRLGDKGRTVMKLQHLTRLVEIYGKWESQTNASTSTSEKIGRIPRRTLQMTSNKEIQRDLEIKEDADQIIQYLTHSLEIYG